jgi:DNA-binding NarL/FixJ family response regulator
MLEDDPAILVVGEAEDGHQAVQLARDLRPRVVVMDFALPSMNGAVAARQILRTAPETAILILSMHAEPSYVRTCLEAGVRGYLLKNAMDLEMVAAVKQVAAGKQVLDPRLGSLGPGDDPPQLQLTTRELEVLQLIVHGKSNKEIAAMLTLSANTVAVHRANIMQTLGIHNTAELVVYAIRQGLVSIA